MTAGPPSVRPPSPVLSPGASGSDLPESFEVMQFRRTRKLQYTYLSVICIFGVCMIIGAFVTPTESHESPFELAAPHIFGLILALILIALREAAHRLPDQEAARRRTKVVVLAMCTVWASGSLMERLNASEGPQLLSTLFNRILLSCCQPYGLAISCLCVSLPTWLYALLMAAFAPCHAFDVGVVYSLERSGADDAWRGVGGVVVLFLILTNCLAVGVYGVVYHLLRAQYQTQLRLQLEHVMEARERYLGAVSHDLGTPISALQMGFSKLLSLGGLVAQHERLLSSMQATLGLLATIRSRAIVFSRTQSGKLPTPMMGEVQIDVVMGNLKQVVEIMPKGLDVKMSYTVADSVPSRVLSDADWILMMMVNLLSNAFKQVRDGLISVTIDTAAAGTMLVFEVADTGPGVPDEFVPCLFEPFRQANRWSYGTGLGLYHVQQLALALHGKASYRPNTPTGAVFTVCFPCRVGIRQEPYPALAPAVRAPTLASVGQPQPPPSPDLPRSVSTVSADAYDESKRPLHGWGAWMIVEDSPFIREVVQTMLEGSGADEIFEADNGQAALDKVTVDGVRPVWVLMDVRMEPVGGIECTRSLRDWERQRCVAAKDCLRIIVLSANGSDATCREECFRAGVDDVLDKPLQMPLLLQSMERIERQYSNQPYSNAQPVAQAHIAQQASCRGQGIRLRTGTRMIET